MEEFLAIGIVGALLSTAVEYLQVKFGMNSKEARTIAIVGAIMLGTMVWAIAQTPYYQSVLGVLASASTVYAMFFSSKKSNADGSLKK